MTPQQLQLLHRAVREAQLNDAQYRVILKNVADVTTSKALNNQTFEDVMAVLEDRGFRHLGKPQDYWRSKVAARNSLCGERLLSKVHALAKDQPYPLGALVRRFTQGKTDQPEKLMPREAYALVEALKQIHTRQEKERRQPKLFEESPVASDQLPISSEISNSKFANHPVPAQGGAPDDEHASFYQDCQDLPF